MPEWKGIVGKAFTAAEFDAYVRSIDFSNQWRAQFCVVHNTGIPQFKDWHSVSGDVRMHALEHYYRATQGWSAGPHVFVADDFIWAFTPLWLQGVHAPSWNRVAWGVELVGDYSAEQLNAGVYRNGISALSTLHRVGKLNPQTIRLHREDPLTTHGGCPGSRIVKAQVIQLVAAGIADDQFADVTSGSSTTAPLVITQPTIRIGDRGPAVASLQGLLGMTGLKGPGTFGPRTHEAVIKFQKARGLRADGVVGPTTWRALLGGN